MNAKSGLLLFAALVSFAPQASAQRPPPASRDLSLLPGPTLLAPARGAPQRTESISIVPISLLRAESAPRWQFVRGPRYEATPTPVKGSIISSSGTLRLKSSEDEKAGSVAPNPQSAPTLSPLRFDAKLPPLDTNLKKSSRDAR